MGPEILSPCGSFESLVSAVNNGADAVYFGGRSFGARKFAKNFDDEEIISAIKYAHFYGVKVYMTVNIITYEEEIDELIKYVRFLHKNNVDALIVQDAGLMYLLKRKFPNLEIHSSTQSHNFDDYSLMAMKSLGCHRCVLAREMSLDEIKSLKTDIEKEVFVHGAICNCYSGNCLFSKFTLNRSGNRGECAQSCRMKYNFYQNNKKINTKGEYLLSPKSMYTLDKVGELIDAGITSFKIEGRMKSKEYTGYVTRLYKEKINEYLKDKKVTVSNIEVNNLKKLYNREFTNGYLFNKYGNDFINITSSNHLGVVIGEVIFVDKKIIKFKLTDDLYQEDGIRFDNDEGMICNKIYNSKMLLVNHLNKGDIAIVDNKLGIEKAKIVRKTIDVNLNKMINSIEERKVDVSIKCNATVGNKLFIEVSDGIDKVIKEGNVVEKAINNPTSKERIIEQLSKLGSTSFRLKDIDVDTDNAFIPIKELNELRREALDELKTIRENYIPHEFVEKEYSIDDKKVSKETKITVSINNEKQLLEVINYNVDSIYTSNYDLYNKYKDKYNIYYKVSRVEHNYIDLKNERVLATNMSSLYKYSKDNYVVTDSYLNAVNSYSVKALESLGSKRVTLSYENTINNLKELKGNLDNTEVIVYGTPTLMIMKYDIIDYLVDSPDKYKEFYKYYLESVNKDKFRVERIDNLTYIYHKEPVNLIDDLDDIKETGVGYIRVEFLDEDINTVRNIMNEVTNG